MSSTPWIVLQQVREALKNARPDEAQRLLAPLIEENNRKAWRMLPDVAAGYAERGERCLRAEDVEAAWAELLRGEAVDASQASVAQLREKLTRFGLASAKALLENGKPLPAVHLTLQLRERKVRHPDLQLIQDAAQDWLQAQEQADRGDFLLASQTLERLRPKLPVPPTGLDRFMRELEERHGQFRAAIGRMQDALEAKRWSEALRSAEEAVASAPQNREAQQARTRAWEALKPAPVGQQFTLPLETSSGDDVPSTATAPTPQVTGPLKRFLLWIDGVGGYLVCLGKQVTFGQATSEGPIDIPIFADVSRFHANLTRDDEGYLVEANRPMQVNGTTVDRSFVQSGDKLTLGGTCQFVFRRPIASSMTAMLTLVSGHRMPLAVDGVMLMADNLILGPKGQSHITIPGMTRSVILMKQGAGLAVKYAGEYRVGGELCQNHAPLPLSVSVEGDAFTFAVEPLPPGR